MRDWREIERLFSWTSLLIGNGASRAVWDDFKYDTLFDVACDPELENGLSLEDQRLFEALGDTRNFEGVLGALNTAGTVCDALGLDTQLLLERYNSVKAALVAAVHRVHVPWRSVSRDALLQLRAALRTFDRVYSTNYDLLVYWAVMAEHEGEGFRDYFFSGSRFDVTNTEVWQGRTKVHYLHGALHLYYETQGGTFKAQGSGFINLLDLFGRLPDGVPLCITEGTAAQKLAAIARSDYLSFALQQFVDDRGSLVIFGQGLGETDEHLVEILKRHRERHIAVGVYPGDHDQVVAEKARLQHLLPAADLLFFDSRSHPLGDPSLKITV